MIGSAKLCTASSIDRMPESVNIIGATNPVIPRGTHSVTHHTTIHSIIPRASCGENAGRDLLEATSAMLDGEGTRIMPTKRIGPRTRPMFSFFIGLHLLFYSQTLISGSCDIFHFWHVKNIRKTFMIGI